MSSPISMDERRRLRAQHTCVGDAMSSMNCRACNAGVPFPALVSEDATLDDLLDAICPQRSR